MSYTAELRERQFRFMRNVAHLINYAFENGFQVSGGELHRSQETQQRHVAEGRSQTMNSMHLKRLAIDLNIFVDGYLLFSNQNKVDGDLLKARPLGEMWTGLHPDNRWGGDFDQDGNPLNGKFKDGSHFEMNFQ